MGIIIFYVELHGFIRWLYIRRLAQCPGRRKFSKKWYLLGQILALPLTSHVNLSYTSLCPVSPSAKWRVPTSIGLLFRVNTYKVIKLCLTRSIYRSVSSCHLVEGELSRTCCCCHPVLDSSFLYQSTCTVSYCLPDYL